MTIFGHKVFTDVIVKMRSWGWPNMTGVLIRGRKSGHRHKERGLCGNRNTNEKTISRSPKQWQHLIFRYQIVAQKDNPKFSRVKNHVILFVELRCTPE